MQLFAILDDGGESQSWQWDFGNELKVVSLKKFITMATNLDDVKITRIVVLGFIWKYTYTCPSRLFGQLGSARRLAVEESRLTTQDGRDRICTLHLHLPRCYACCSSRWPSRPDRRG